MLTRLSSVVMASVVLLVGCGGSDLTATDSSVAQTGSGYAEEVPSFVGHYSLSVTGPEGAQWTEDFVLTYTSGTSWSLRYIGGETTAFVIDGEVMGQQADSSMGRIEYHTLPGTKVTFRDGELIERRPDGEVEVIRLPETRSRPGYWFPPFSAHSQAEQDGSGRGAFEFEAGGPGRWLLDESGVPLSFVDTVDGTYILTAESIKVQGTSIPIPNSAIGAFERQALGVAGT